MRLNTFSISLIMEVSNVDAPTFLTIQSKGESNAIVWV